MSESVITVWWHKCLKCGRVVASLNRTQAIWNTVEHYTRHKVVVDPNNVRLTKTVINTDDVAQSSDAE